MAIRITISLPDYIYNRTLSGKIGNNRSARCAELMLKGYECEQRELANSENGLFRIMSGDLMAEGVLG